MTFKTYKDVKDYILNKTDVISVDESFALAKACSALLLNIETEHQARDLIIRILDLWKKIDPVTLNMWNDLVEAAGLHPYVEYLRLTGAASIRKEYFKSNVLKGVCFHEEQLALAMLLETNKSLIVSAPTSFGKSLLIEEIVASKRYKNIVIVQPTLALLDETRKKLQKYKNEYNIIVSTNQTPKDGRNLFLFTGERVVEYVGFPSVDFFIIDEFYKLSMSRDDERAPTLNHALCLLLKMTKHFYMLGPLIKSIPRGITEKYNATFFHTRFSTVALDISDVTKGNIKNEEREGLLFELLKSLNEPTLIYCSSPEKSENISAKFLDSLKSENTANNSIKNTANESLIEWIDKNIDSRWRLRNALMYSIGYHHGALPRHLASSMIDSFNKGDIKYLFCTSTIIEGVNTSAKNVVLFDRKKGPKPIDYFDFKNIIGRSGRMNKHFIGRVFKFHKEPDQLELDIDIPLFTQEDAPLELLIQMEKGELSDSSINKLKEFENLDSDIKQLIIRNSGISINGQLEVIKVLENDFDRYYSNISWTGYPKYEQLLTVLDLGWKYLMKKSESRGGAFTPNQLAFITIEYGLERSLRKIIQKEFKSEYWVKNVPFEDIRLQKIVHMILQISRHWFDYKLPKLLSALSNIQTFVCAKKMKKPGDYYFFSALIENNFLPPNLSILLDYDIPASAIVKMQAVFNKNMSFEGILEKLKKTNLEDLGLIPYEIEKLKALL